MGGLAFAASRITQGPRSFLTYLRLTRRGRAPAPAGRVVRLRLRPLGGRSFRVRPGGPDAGTILETFADPGHLPPPEAGRPRLIWDLGAGIGLTTADLAERYPGARVVAVEADPAKAALAQANLAPWGRRCDVIEAAACPRDGEDALSPYSLLALDGRDATVDFARIDVGGAERALLRENAGWTRQVRTVSVQIHAPYTASECERDLGTLGFETRAERHDPARVIGFRTPTNVSDGEQDS